MAGKLVELGFWVTARFRGVAFVHAHVKPRFYQARFFIAMLVSALAGTATFAFDTANVAVDLNRPYSGYAIINAFPGVQFNQPIAIASPPGETNRLFVAERAGIICVITNLAAPTRSEFLNVTNSTSAGYIESGLLGFAFHPNFKTNGQFYVMRSYFGGNLTFRLSCFKVSAANPNKAAFEETVLIDHADISPNHNGGDVHFGPDGYLYFSTGDEGPILADRRGEIESIDGGLFGGIFRIDVDQRPGNFAPTPHPSVVGAYSIPADNPFIGVTNYLGRSLNPAQVRTEFYALGLRNPWRFSFDSLTGQLFVGDVGADWAEEIDSVTKGANYGWPYWEGKLAHELAESGPDESNFQPPLYSYDHGFSADSGHCIIGGIVCRNASIPDLEGWYIFGDERSGSILRMRPDDPKSVKFLAREPGIVAFGRDPSNGDVLIASFGRGEIRRIVYASPEEEHIPSRLSATGVFSDLTQLTPTKGLVPYDVNVSFWSDNALKRRWHGLMKAGTQMAFSPTNNWTFPDGAVWVKHFELEMERGNPASARRIETRLLFKTHEEFFGYTYRWDADGKDAQLVAPEGYVETFNIKDPDGNLREQAWNYPPRGDCAACHTKVGGGALGFNTQQLNRDSTIGGTTQNQLQRLVDAGYIKATTIDSQSLPALVTAEDTTQPLEFRVKSYLAANCSQCHQPGGTWGALWNGNWSAPMSQANIINGTSLGGYTADSRVIVPRSLTNSMMYHRLTREDIRMPPIASSVFDEEARDLLTEWIMGLPDSSLTESEIGAGLLTGSMTQRGSVLVVSGIGKGMTGQGDRLHLVSTNLSRGGYVQARIGGIPGARPNMKAGLMLRASDAVDAGGVWIARGSDGKNLLVARSSQGQSAAIVASSAQQEQPWMRLVRIGDRVSAWESGDGLAWNKVGETDFKVSGAAMAGIAVASGEDWRFATAEFDELQSVSISLQLIDSTPGTPLPLPKDLTLEATVETNGVAVERVEFYAGAEFLGSANSAPWRLKWTNAWAGNYAIVATAFDESGVLSSSEPLMVNFTAPTPLATYLGAVRIETNWSQTIGTIGRAIPGIITDLAGRATLMPHATVKTYSTPGLLADSAGPIPATAWVSQNDLRLELRPGDEIPRRLTLFVAPYESTNALTIGLLDLATGATLDQQVVSNVAGKQFVSWTIRGAIVVQVRSQSAGLPSLSGIFLDPVSMPTVRLLSLPAVVPLPATITLQAEAFAEGRNVQSVEFWDGDVKLGEIAEAPFELKWPAISGNHSFAAVVWDEYGLTAQSEAIPVICNLPKANVSFIGEDRRTQGDWIGRYGNVGQLIHGGWTNLPPTINAPVNGNPFGLTPLDTNRFSLLRQDGQSRFLHCYYVDPLDTMEVGVTPRDGEATRVSFYFVDWMGTGRFEAVSLVDAETGAELDRRTIASFAGGAYLTWDVIGDVRVLMRSLNDYNTLFSAMFFDPPAAEWKISASSTNVTLPAAITLRAEPLIDGKTVDHIDFYSDQERIGSATNAPYEFVWTNALAGAHSVFARAVGYSGVATDTATITINCTLPAGRATFAGQNGSIKGNWWKAYGADGFRIPLGPDQQREFVQVTFDGFVGLHEWLPPGSDDRGVYLPDEKLFDAACFYADTTFDATVEFRDGREHMIALYFVDFERVGAGQLLQILDDSNTVLDERTVDDMGEGFYLTWKGQGRLHLHIERLTMWTAICSGIFVGGPIVDSQFWWAQHFGGDLLAVPKWTGDPDADGRPNFVEYALGSDPMTPDSPLTLAASLDGESLTIDLNGSRPTSNGTISAEISTDLVHWQAATLTRSGNDDAIEFAVPATQDGPHFYRIRFNLP